MEEPTLELNINGEEILANRWNSAVFSFAGELAIFDHVFIATAETETGYTGKYIFSGHPQYEDVADFMEKARFPAHYFITEVPECDVSAFEQYHYKDVRNSDIFPKAWTDKHNEDGRGTE